MDALKELKYDADGLIPAVVQDAKDEFGKKGDPQAAVDALDDATRLALLITGSAPLPTANMGDPYGMCPGNPKGLFVGRAMSLKFAVCSELKQSGPGETAKSNGDGAGAPHGHPHDVPVRTGGGSPYKCLGPGQYLLENIVFIGLGPVMPVHVKAPFAMGHDEISRRYPALDHCIIEQLRQPKSVQRAVVAVASVQNAKYG